MKLFYKEASNQHILFHTGNISAIVINKIGSMILVEMVVILVEML